MCKKNSLAVKLSGIYHYLQLMTLKLLLEDTQLSTDQWKTNISLQQLLLVLYCMMQQSVPEVSLKAASKLCKTSCCVSLITCPQY